MDSSKHNAKDGKQANQPPPLSRDQQQLLRISQVAEVVKVFDTYGFTRTHIRRDGKAVDVLYERHASYSADGLPLDDDDIGKTDYVTYQFDPVKLISAPDAQKDKVDVAAEWAKIEAEEDDIVSYIENRTLKPVVMDLLAIGFQFLVSSRDEGLDLYPNIILLRGQRAADFNPEEDDPYAKNQGEFVDIGTGEV